MEATEANGMLHPEDWSAERGRPRVLLEAWEAPWLVDTAAQLVAAGCEVRMCPGPHARTGRRGFTHSCPLVESGECALVAGADLVVVTSPRRPEGIQALREIRRRHHKPPVVIKPGGQPHEVRGLVWAARWHR